MPTVIIYWSPTRTTKQKQAVIQQITETLVAHGGARREDVLVIFQNIEAGDAGRAGHVLGLPAEDAATNDTATSPPPATKV